MSIDGSVAPGAGRVEEMAKFVPPAVKGVTDHLIAEANEVVATLSGSKVCAWAWTWSMGVGVDVSVATNTNRTTTTITNATPNPITFRTDKHLGPHGRGRKKMASSTSKSSSAFSKKDR